MHRRTDATDRAYQTVYTSFVCLTFSTRATFKHVEPFDQCRERHRRVDISFGTFAPNPSAISAVPIIIRKPSASMTIVGLALMKLASGIAASITARTE
jgi:hypothetical protein